MNESNESRQNLSIENAAISGQVGQAGRNLTQVKGEQAVVIDGDRNVVEYHNITQSTGEKEITSRELIMTSPYKGLKKFEPEDAARFFGRDAFLDELEDELTQTNLILLLGASGSGKSSVVRAGLIPRLRQTYGNHFVSLIFTPDCNPFESFYGSLLGRGYSQAKAQLARDVSVETLCQVVEKVRPPEAFWLIVIDQFEELFTTSDASQRDTFIRGLVKLCAERVEDPQLKIVATMRADFLDQLDPSPANVLASLTQKHRPLITQMQPEALRQAIEKPAAQHGVVFEAGLVADIAQAVQGRAGYLPLLQYTLDLLWESEVADEGIHDRTLNIDSYHRLGGVEGALQQRVDEIYRALSPEEQLAAQRIFLRLVEIGGDAAAETDWKPVRRRAARTEFCDEVETKVLGQLIQARLLVSDGVDGPETADELGATVDIAHEILLTSWEQLKEWIGQNREAIALRNRLQSDVRQWRAHKPDDELWSGIKLAKAAALQSDPTFDRVLGGFGSEATAFIKASVGLRDRQEQEKEEQRQRELAQERKARKVAQRVTVGASVGGILMAGLLVISGFQMRKVEIEQIRTSVTSSKAELANNKELNADIESIRAARTLKKSFLQTVMPDAELKTSILAQLQQTAWTGYERNRLEGHQGGDVWTVEFSPDGTQLATSGADGTARLWDTLGKQLAELKGHQGIVWAVVFSPDGTQLATRGEDGTARLWDTSGKQLAELKGHQGDVWAVVFSPDSTQLATSGADGTVRLWPVEKFDELLSRQCDWVRDYLANSANDSDRHLCDGIEPMSTKAKK